MNELSRPALAVFIVGCVLFVAVRLIVVFSAVDHLSGVNWAEYQLADHANCVLGRACRDAPFYPHLWGSRITSLALVPFLAAGLTETAALKFLALLLSCLPFGALVYLAATRLGPWPAAALAALLIVPDREYFVWSLAAWGSYPESHALTFVAVLIWALAWRRRSTAAIALAGTVIGLSVAFSYASAYLAFALLALAPFAGGRSVGRRGYLVFYAACFLGFLPRLIWLSGGFLSQIERVDFLGVHIRQVDFAMWPTWHNVATFWRRMQTMGFWGDFPSGLLVRLGLLWTAFVAVSGGERRRWLSVFPAAFPLAAALFLFFSFVELIQIRHVMALVPCGYLCIACLLGDRVMPAAWAERRRWLRGVESGVKWGLLILVLIGNGRHLAAFIWPSQLDMLTRFRGLEYCRLDLNELHGPEVDRVNCLLDHYPAIWDGPRSFAAGMRTVFLAPNRFADPPLHFKDMRPPHPYTDRGEFYRGIGCAMALKTGVTDAAIRQIPVNDSYPEAHAQARDGYAFCAALSCAAVVEK